MSFLRFHYYVTATLARTAQRDACKKHLGSVFDRYRADASLAMARCLKSAAGVPSRRCNFPSRYTEVQSRIEQTRGGQSVQFGSKMSHDTSVYLLPFNLSFGHFGGVVTFT